MYTDEPVGSHGRGGTVTGVRKFTFDTEYGVRLTDGDFRLTAFGLPEPPGAGGRGVPTYVWLIVAAAVAGAVAVILSRVGRPGGR